MKLLFRYFIFATILCACASNHIDKTGKQAYDAGKTRKHEIPPEIVSHTIECPADKSCYKIRATKGKILGVRWSDQRSVEGKATVWVGTHVKNDLGEELPHRWVYITLPDGVIVYTETNTRGYVRLEGVPEGKCYFQLINPETKGPTMTYPKDKSLKEM